MEISFIYYGLIIINAFAFLSGKNIKLISIPSAIFLVLFVMGKRYDNNFIAYDLANYAFQYENVYDYPSVEVGYKFINIIGNTLGLTFEQFYMILVAVTMSIIFIAVKKIGGNLHLFIMCWLIYFVLISMDQLRNQSALAIMMISIFPFYTKDDKRSLKWIFLFLILATSFHISFILYAVPLYLTYKKNLRFAVWWLIACVVLYIIFMATSATSIMQSLITILTSHVEDSTKYEGYVTGNTSLSSLASLAIYFVTLLALFLLRKNSVKYKGKENNYIFENIDTFLLFFLFSSILLSFLIVNAAFYRFIRDLSFISLAYLGINSTKKSSTFIRRTKTLFFAVVISAGWFVFDIIIKGYILDYMSFFFDNEIL